MDVAKLKVVELKKALAERGLARHGLKKVLVERLKDALGAESKHLNGEGNKEPVEEQPVDEQSTVEQPANELPVEARPVEEQTADEQSVEEQPAVDHREREVSADAFDAERVTMTRSLSVEVVDDEEGLPAIKHAEVFEAVEDILPTLEEHASIDMMELTEGTTEVAAVGTVFSPSSEHGHETAPSTGDEIMATSAVESAEAVQDNERSDNPKMQIEALPGEVFMTEKISPREGKHDRGVQESVKPVIQEKDQTHSRKRSRPNAASMMDLSVEIAPAVETTREVAPSQHPPTNALYIRNFTRPLVVPQVKAMLAGHAGEEALYFWMDAVRTHAFVTFSSMTTATRVRNAVYGLPYPPEPDRKHLQVDYVPADVVEEWVEKEEQQRNVKYEVRYEQGKASLMEISKRTVPGPTIVSADELFKKTVHRPSIYYAEATHRA